MTMSSNINESFFNMIEAQVWQLTDEQTYGMVNQAHAEFLGIDKTDLQHKTLSDILPPDTAETLVNGNFEVFKSRKKMYSETWLTNSNGENHLLAITKIPKLDKNGKVKYLVCTGSDITEYYKPGKGLFHINNNREMVIAASPNGTVIVEEQISSNNAAIPEEIPILSVSDISKEKQADYQQNEDTRGVIEMVSAVCHELNQPLQAILGFSELLMMEVKRGDPLHDKLSRISTLIDETRDITRKIHSFKKYKTNKYIEGKMANQNTARK